MSADSTLAPTATLALEQACQDALISARLPAWMTRLEPQRLTRLCQALATSLSCRQRLQARLAQVQGIEAFVRSQLQAAFDQRYGAGQPVTALFFRQGYPVPLRGQYWPSRTPLMQLEFTQVPLLEAAMRNFSAEQAGPQGQPRGNALLDAAGNRLQAPTAQAFARLCRELDLGARYQRHLADVLQAPADAAAAQVAQLLRANLLVDACKARAEAVLSEADLVRIETLCAGAQPGPPPVVAKRLQVLGCALEQIILFDVIEEGWLRNTSQRVLAYIPGDPHGPWSVHDDLEQFARKRLGKRLRDPEYLEFFARFVPLRDRPQLLPALAELYRDVAVWATRELDDHMLAYPTPLFEQLGAAWVSRVQADAATLLAPVARLDHAAQLAQQRWLLAQGTTLLGVAGLFIPGIGAVLLGVLAWDLLGEVFHGVEAWHDGDSKAALDHLGHVAVELAWTAAALAGVAVARQAWQRSAMVDSLLPARLENGQVKLWREDLAAFRSAAPAPAVGADAQGLRRVGGRAWLELDHHCYAVRQRADDQRWQLQPRNGFGPTLRGNGAGAWRLESERVWEWRDPRAMLRRFGGRFAELDDSRLDALLRIHQLEADQLRALHLHNQVPEADLVDSAQRLLLEQRIGQWVTRLRAGQQADDSTLLMHARRLPGAAQATAQTLGELAWQSRRELLQRVYDSAQDSADAASAQLRRVFPRLPARLAQALLRRADGDDLQRLLHTGRVPLRLAETAREALRRSRVTRVLQALCFDLPQDGDLARLGIGLLAAPSAVRWRLFEGHAQGALLAAAGQGGREYGLLHEGGLFTLLDAQSNALGGPGELFETLAGAWPGQASAQAMRAQVAEAAFADRARLERLLLGQRPSWFRAPQRQLDGRVGYPLSGRLSGLFGRRGRPQALVDRVHGLFPELTQTQIDALLRGVQASGRQVDSVLEQVRRQSQLLAQRLGPWAQRGQSAEERDHRQYLARTLTNCWQCSVAEELIGETPVPEFWWSQIGARPGELPELPDEIRINRVAVLSMRGMQLERIPDSFLRAFTRLRVLELPGNRLQRLPAVLPELQRLECLDLFNNHIALTAADAAALAHCTRLRYLNLSHNPLGRVFSVAGLRELVELRLNNTRLGTAPQGLAQCQRLHTLDLRDNMLTALPEGFYRFPAWNAGRVWLQGNPLQPAERQRLRRALGAPIAALQPASELVVPRLRWLDAVDSQYRNEMGAAWAVVEAFDASEAFFHLLLGLTQTADFVSPSGGRDLAWRVLRMLQLMEEHADLRQELFANASALTCQDSVALRFADLELRVQVWQAERGVVEADRQPALLRLGRQLWRLEAVDRIALEDVHARRAGGGQPDEIEVLLAYRLALREPLELPLQTRQMLFGQVSGVSPAQVEQALARVLEAESSEQIAFSLVEREFWCRYLRSRHAARFEALNAPFHRQLEVLMADEALAEGERVERVGQVQAQRTQAERDTLLELTRQALDTPDAEPEIFV